MAWFIEDGSTWELEMERNRLIEEEENDEFNFSRRFALDTPSINANSNDFTLNAAAAASTLTPGGITTGLTYSASCPSFTSIYEISSDELIQDICNDSSSNSTTANMAMLPPATSSNGGIVNTSNTTATTGIVNNTTQPNGPAFSHMVNQNAPMIFNRSQRLNQFGYTQANSNMNSMMSGMNPNRRGMLQSSASFTSLSAMEADHKRRQAKRKKGLERWSKKTRQKSFDSSSTGTGAMTSPSPSVDFSTFPSTNDPEEDTFMTADSNEVGFSIDDFPSTFTTDAQWPNVSSSGLTPLDTGASDGAFTSTIATTTQPSSNEPLPTVTSVPTSNTTVEEDFLFGGDQVSTLLDELDTEVMELTSETSGSTSTPAAAATTTKTNTTTNSNSTSSKELSPVASTTSIMPSLATMLKDALERKRCPGKPCPPIDTAIAGRLFGSEKCKETAGSLWLMLHASKCNKGASSCDITSCDVMKRVVTHCVSCSKAVGACQDVCNDAKTMLLHYASCDTPNCMLCTQLKEIDQAHEAIANSEHKIEKLLVAPSTASSAVSASSAPARHAQPMLVTSLTGSSESTSGSSSKHIPIQPSPMPPTGIAGAGGIPLFMANYPQFGALGLYLEQTSPVFRAEVNDRVEKRVKNVAGQDLIQHMQKRTRLRSLDEIRIAARTIVLREIEQEIQLHIARFGGWPRLNMAAAAAAATNANVGGNSVTIAGPGVAAAESEENGAPNPNSTLPAYLLSAAAAGFAAFYAQQSELANAAMKFVPKVGTEQSGRPLSGKPPTSSSSSSSSSATRKKNEEVLMV